MDPARTRSAGSGRASPRCAQASSPRGSPAAGALRSAGLGAQGRLRRGPSARHPACPLASIEKGGKGAQHSLPGVEGWDGAGRGLVQLAARSLQC